MGVLLALVVLVAAVLWLRWVGALDGLTDRIRDALAVFYPSRPLSRRALPGKLLRAAARTVTVGVSGTALLPTHIEIRVNPADVETFAEALDWLGRDVAAALRKLATTKGWMVPDGPQVTIVPDPERPLRMPRASGHIGALSPEEIRTLERSGGGPDRPGAGSAAGDTLAAGAGAGRPPEDPPDGDGAPEYRAGPVPTDWTGSALTVAEGVPPAAAGPDGAPAASPPTLRADAPGAAGPGDRTRAREGAVPPRPGDPGSPPADAPGIPPAPPPPPPPPGPDDAVPPVGAAVARSAGRHTMARATDRTAATVPVAVGTLHLRLVSGQAAEADLSAVLTPAQAPLVLGRSRQCDLRVRDRHASGRHCSFAIGPESGTLTVEDLGSTNGTFVGGNRIRRATLRPGDTLRIGDSSWRIELDGITSTAEHRLP